MPGPHRSGFRALRLEAPLADRIGVDGVAQVNAPQTELTASLAPHAHEFVDAAGLVRERCALRESISRGSFVVRQSFGLVTGYEATYLAKSPAAKPEDEAG